jgi:hypothetical protein
MEKSTRKKTRAHYVLFCMNTPYKPKQVQSKIAYNRKDKHKLKESLNHE